MSSSPHNFVYVPTSEYKPAKDNLLKLIDTVEQSIKSELKFTTKFIGSSKRNMITKDTKSNKGYDFDLNIVIDPSEKNKDPKKLKDFLRASFDKYVEKFGYDYCEDSTSVFTIKVKDVKNSKIIHSADFGIVRKVGNKKQVLKNRKDINTYCWEFMRDYPKKLSQMVEWCKEKNLWDEVRNKYIENKNKNTDPNKKSRMIYADTVNQVFLHNGGDKSRYVP